MTLYMRGVLMALVTALLFGAMSSVAKLISADGLSQMSVMVYRTFFVVAAVGLWFLCTGKKESLRISREIAPRYILLGFATLVCNAAGFMMSCMYLSVPQAVVLHYMFPLTTMAGAWLITKEKPTGVEIVSAALVILGLYISFASGKETMEMPSIPGVVWGVVSIFGFSAQVLLSRSMGRSGKSDPLVQLFYTNLFGGIIIFVGKSIFSGWGDLAGLSWPVFALMQYPAIACSLIAFGLLFASLRYIPPTTASLICTLEIVVALAAMPLLLGSWPSPREVVGAGIILAAVTGSTLLKNRQLQSTK